MTILDPVKAQLFIKEYGKKRDENQTSQNGQRYRQNGQKPHFGQVMAAPKPLIYLNARLHIWENNRAPDEFVIRHLQRDAEAKALGAAVGATVKMEPGINREFPFKSVSCGLWDYTGGNGSGVLVFTRHTQEIRIGVATFRERAVTLRFKPPDLSSPTTEIEIPYSWVEGISIARKGEPSPAITFTLPYAPRIYHSDSEIELALSGLAIGGSPKKENFKRKRILSAWATHGQFAGSCFVYRIDLLHAWHLENAANLKKAPEIPRIVDWWTNVTDSNVFSRDSTALNYALAKLYPEFPFGLKFQMQRLAQNGYLPPGKVYKLLSDAHDLLKRSGSDIAIRSIRKLASKIPHPGPDTVADEVSLHGLRTLLADCERVAKREALEEKPKYNVELGLVYRYVCIRFPFPTSAFLLSTS